MPTGAGRAAHPDFTSGGGPVRWWRPRGRSAGLEEATVIQAGDKAPSVRAAAYDGTIIDLGAPGKPTVLYFYPKASTPG